MPDAKRDVTRYACCGGKKSWSRNTHLPGCRYALRTSVLHHPSNTAVRTADRECPAHPGQGRFDCTACEGISEERREGARVK